MTLLPKSASKARSRTLITNRLTMNTYRMIRLKVAWNEHLQKMGRG